MTAGTSSYECPFQTPASTSLRDLRDSETTRNLFGEPVSSQHHFAHLRLLEEHPEIGGKPSSAQGRLAHLYATWVDARQELISLSHHVHNVTRYLLSLSRILPGIRRSRRGIMLPVIVEDAYNHPLVPQNYPRLRSRAEPRSPSKTERAQYGLCLLGSPEYYRLRVIRLAGTIRWFDGNPHYDPPFDLIVYAFEACSDSCRRSPSYGCQHSLHVVHVPGWEGTLRMR